jgi:PhnB protein
MREYEAAAGAGADTPTSKTIKTSIAPWLSVAGATDAVAFYKAAFGAVERYRLEDDAGRIAVAQLAIEGADFWVQEDASSSAESMNDRPVRLILTVDDPDAMFARAVAAGAAEVFAVSEEHGWRTGRIADPFGHQWEISKPLG